MPLAPLIDRLAILPQPAEFLFQLLAVDRRQHLPLTVRELVVPRPRLLEGPQAPPRPPQGCGQIHKPRPLANFRPRAARQGRLLQLHFHLPQPSHEPGPPLVGFQQPAQQVRSLVSRVAGGGRMRMIAAVPHDPGPHVPSLVRNNQPRDARANRRVLEAFSTFAPLDWGINSSAIRTRSSRRRQRWGYGNWLSRVPTTAKHFTEPI